MNASAHSLADSEAQPILRPKGIPHIVSISDASSTLGIISTLVFCMSFGWLYGVNTEENKQHTWEGHMIFLSFGMCLASFPMVFSVLEQYYVKSLAAIDRYLAHRVETFSEEPGSLNRSDSLTMEKMEKTRVELGSDSEQVFRTFNVLRKKGQEAMWQALIMLLFAVSLKLDHMDLPRLPANVACGACLCLIAVWDTVVACMQLCSGKRLWKLKFRAACASCSFAGALLVFLFLPTISAPRLSAILLLVTVLEILVLVIIFMWYVRPIVEKHTWMQ